MPMFEFFEKFTKQVANHTTGIGAVWFVIMLGFRVFTVSTVGNAVYSDEQDKFQCSTTLIGCPEQCYNQFAKISHIRFWSFQILFSLTPAIFFYVYDMYTRNQIAKIESAMEAYKKKKECPNDEVKRIKEMLLLSKRCKRVGAYEMKKARLDWQKKEDKKNDKKEEAKNVPHSKKLIIANIVHLVLRLVIEIIGIIISGNMFNIQNGSRGKQLGWNQLFWNEVPGVYYCKDFGDDYSLQKSCYQHFMGKSHVPCFVSRQYEKTIFLRYMNITALICVCLTSYEIVAAIYRLYDHRQTRKGNNFKTSVVNTSLLDVGDSMETKLMTSPTILRVAVNRNEVISVMSRDDDAISLISRGSRRYGTSIR